jgi:sec-independent protein translocase protein TatA
MFGLGLPEIIIIIIALVILFFGGKKLTELARGMGRFTGEYKKGRAEIENELKEMDNKDESQ